MSLKNRIIDYLESTPNGFATDWSIMFALYLEAKMGDRSNGIRIANIRRLARKNEGFHILSNDADMIALTK